MKRKFDPSNGNSGDEPPKKTQKTTHTPTTPFRFEEMREMSGSELDVLYDQLSLQIETEMKRGEDGDIDIELITQLNSQILQVDELLLAKEGDDLDYNNDEELRRRREIEEGDRLLAERLYREEEAAMEEFRRKEQERMKVDEEFAKKLALQFEQERERERDEDEDDDDNDEENTTTTTTPTSASSSSAPATTTTTLTPTTSTTTTTPLSALEKDEELARILQEQFDLEYRDSQTPTTTTTTTPITPGENNNSNTLQQQQPQPQQPQQLSKRKRLKKMKKKKKKEEVGKKKENYQLLDLFDNYESIGSEFIGGEYSEEEEEEESEEEQQQQQTSIIPPPTITTTTTTTTNRNKSSSQLIIISSDDDDSESEEIILINKKRRKKKKKKSTPPPPPRKRTTTISPITPILKKKKKKKKKRRRRNITPPILLPSLSSSSSSSQNINSSSSVSVPRMIISSSSSSSNQQKKVIIKKKRKSIIVSPPPPQLEKKTKEEIEEKERKKKDELLLILKKRRKKLTPIKKKKKIVGEEQQNRINRILENQESKRNRNQQLLINQQQQKKKKKKIFIRKKKTEEESINERMSRLAKLDGLKKQKELILKQQKIISPETKRIQNILKKKQKKRLNNFRKRNNNIIIPPPPSKTTKTTTNSSSSFQQQQNQQQIQQQRINQQLQQKRILLEERKKRERDETNRQYLGIRHNQPQQQMMVRRPPLYQSRNIHHQHHQQQQQQQFNNRIKPPVLLTPQQIQYQRKLLLFQHQQKQKQLQLQLQQQYQRNLIQKRIQQQQQQQLQPQRFFPPPSSFNSFQNNNIIQQQQQQQQRRRRISDVTTRKMENSELSNAMFVDKDPYLLECETPEDMTITLYKHQKIALHWLKDRENGPINGGILADDMGLGKTIELAALMVAHELPRTLIVAPVAVIGQWQRELLSKTTKNWKIYKYHGGTRKKNISFLKTFDVIITTYGIVRTETSLFDRKKNKMRPSKNGPIASINWDRVILDEAHLIKNPATNMAQSCCKLKSKKRFCLTGTPLQNKLEDLYSLYNFLKFRPYNNKKEFKDLINRVRQDPSKLKKFQRIQKKVLLRRHKNQKINGKPIVKLPPKHVLMVEMNFDEQEQSFYDVILKKSQVRFNRFLEEGSVMKNYAHVLTMLLRLRQACDHPFLVQRLGNKALQKLFHVDDDDDSDEEELEGEDDVDDDYNPLKEEEQDKKGEKIVIDISKNNQIEYNKELTNKQLLNECAICLDAMVNPICTKCTEDHHWFCSECLFIHSNSTENPKCPSCRRLIRNDILISLKKRREIIFNKQQKENSINNIKGLQPSSKTKALLEKIGEIIKKDIDVKDKSKQDKILVISQWTSFLDLLHVPFNNFKVKNSKDEDVSIRFMYESLDGRMSINQREATIERFNGPTSKIRILLVSMHACGVGLNLNRANHVFLLDPWWNPSVEEQAIDRVYRLGQEKPVYVYRLKIRGSVEDKIEKIKQKKQDLANVALGQAISKSKISLQDFKLLFQ